MFGIGAQELAVILIVALLVFGPKRLPELARSLGRGLAEFRRASSDLRQELSLEDEPPRPAPRPTAAQAVDPGTGEERIAPPPPRPGTSVSATPDSAAEGHGDLADLADLASGEPVRATVPARTARRDDEDESSSSGG